MAARAARGSGTDNVFSRALRLATLPWNDGEEGKFVASLEMFKCGSPEIALPDDTRIRRRSEDDVAIMADLNSSYIARELSDFVAVIRVSAMRFTDAEARARETFDDVITSLRLLGARQVRLGEGFAIQEDTPDSARTISFWYRPSLPPLWKLLPYELHKRGDDDLRAVYGQLPRAFEGPARVAVSRFNSAHTRDTEEDQFIDIWIALEALFSPSDKREVTYRIALRLAHFIADPGDEREEVYRTTLDSYDVRSEVIHGRKLTLRRTKKLKLDSFEVLRRTEDYLRRCLWKIVLSEKPFKAEELDKAIARGRQGKDE